MIQVGVGRDHQIQTPDPESGQSRDHRLQSPIDTAGYPGPRVDQNRRPPTLNQNCVALPHIEDDHPGRRRPDGG